MVGVGMVFFGLWGSVYFIVLEGYLRGVWDGDRCRVLKSVCVCGKCLFYVICGFFVFLRKLVL